MDFRSLGTILEQNLYHSLLADFGRTGCKHTGFQEDRKGRLRRTLPLAMDPGLGRHHLDDRTRFRTGKDVKKTLNSWILRLAFHTHVDKPSQRGVIDPPLVRACLWIASQDLMAVVFFLHLSLLEKSEQKSKAATTLRV